MKQKTRDSKKRIAFPIQLFGEGSEFAEIPDEIHVVPTGKWMHPMYGEMEITPAEIAKFVENFKAHVRKDLPITAGHNNGMNGGELPAVGWFKDLIDRGVKGLYAVVEWTEEGKKSLQERAFKYFSPEFYESYSDPETQAVYEYVLVGGALTNKPYFKELEPVIAFSEPNIINQFNNMTLNLKDILEKKPEDLDDAEKAFLVEHKSELSSEQSEAFKSALDGGEAETEEEKTARLEKEQGDANEAAGKNRDGSDKAPVAAREPKGGKMIQMSEAEVRALEAKANQGAEALSRIEASERAATIKELVFSESNKVGKFLPKQEGALGSFLKSLSETQRNAFKTLVAGMPKADDQIFSEKGDAGASVAKAVSKELEEAVKSFREKNKDVNYAQAVKAVFKENPDLEKRYSEAVNRGEAAE